MCVCFSLVLISSLGVLFLMYFMFLASVMLSFVWSLLVKRSAAKNVSEATYFVSDWVQNFNVISPSVPVVHWWTKKWRGQYVVFRRCLI